MPHSALRQNLLSHTHTYEGYDYWWLHELVYIAQKVAVMTVKLDWHTKRTLATLRTGTAWRMKGYFNL